jgi:hypothetical protein
MFVAQLHQRGAPAGHERGEIGQFSATGTLRIDNSIETEIEFAIRGGLRGSLEAV